MRELFYEESANIVECDKERRKYLTIDIISKVSYVLFGIFLFILFLSFDFRVFQQGFLTILISLLLNLLFPAIFFLTGFFAGKIKNRFYNEFDYTLVSGQLRFSKVIMNKKRKFIFKFDCSQIERMGKVNSTDYNRYSMMPNIKIDYLTSNSLPQEGKNFYYIVAVLDSEKHLLIVESTENFIKNILQFTNIIVWEK